MSEFKKKTDEKHNEAESGEGSLCKHCSECENLDECMKKPLQQRKELISAISHEIRTPISGIMGMTKIAMENADKPERVTECLKKVVDSSQYLLSLVNNVLDMSKLDSGKITLSNEPFNIVKMAEGCCNIIQGQLIDKNLKLHCSCEHIRHRNLIGDSLRLSQIIINILGNSAKFTHKGEITFCINEIPSGRGKATFRFEFRDTGIGMSREYLPTLFEPFSQDSEHDRAAYRGTGLGMTIVKHYVDMMGGEIRVDSVQGKGTRFVMELGFEIDENPTEDKTEVHSNFRLDGEKILIAEDNELNAEITAEILKETGAEIVIATNGKNAVDIYSHSKKDDFDLILMDVRMPEEDGIAAAKEIRHLNRSDAADIPIIAITANTLDEDRSSAIDAGMNAYLSKPIDANSLFKTLKKVL